MKVQFSDVLALDTDKIEWIELGSGGRWAVNDGTNSFMMLMLMRDPRPKDIIEEEKDTND